MVCALNYSIILFVYLLSMFYQVIFGVLDPEEKKDWEDGEDNQGLGYDIVYCFLNVLHIKYVGVPKIVGKYYINIIHMSLYKLSHINIYISKWWDLTRLMNCDNWDEIQSNILVNKFMIEWQIFE